MKKGLLLIVVFVCFIGGIYFLRTKNLNLFKPVKKNDGKIKITQEPVQQIFLTVSQPVDKSTVNTSSLVVKGETLENVDVFVNDQETKADSTGNFFVTINLEEGENNIIVVANDSQGNYSEQELTVTLVTPE